MKKTNQQLSVTRSMVVLFSTTTAPLFSDSQYIEYEHVLLSGKISILTASDRPFTETNVTAVVQDNYIFKPVY